MSLPDARGYFGRYGGRFVPETLMACLDELERAFAEALSDESFVRELDEALSSYVGRPTPLTPLFRFAEGLGNVAVFAKREDLAHTGAHKINHCVGHALLARRMGRRRLVAETGAGQHGVATAAAAARFGLECRIYMGEVDMRRQRPNVLRMRLFGAEVVPVRGSSGTLRDATSEAIRDWVASHRTSYYAIGSTVGPHPYPKIVREFQAVVGREARRQILERAGRLPDLVVACVGGGSNAIGLFHAFRDDESVELVGVEAGGAQERHAASLGEGRPGVLHGAFTYVLQDPAGQVLDAHSVAPGLDYPAVGPEHAHLRDTGRARYERASDAEALSALDLLCRSEGILPALESSHALAWVLRRFRERPGCGEVVLVNLSGRGDKDLEALERGERS